MIEYYAGYDKQTFWSQIYNLSGRQPMRVRVLYSTTFFSTPPINIFFTTSVTLLVPKFSEVVGLLST